MNTCEISYKSVDRFVHLQLKCRSIFFQWKKKNLSNNLVYASQNEEIQNVRERSFLLHHPPSKFLPFRNRIFHPINQSGSSLIHPRGNNSKEIVYETKQLDRGGFPSYNVSKRHEFLSKCFLFSFFIHP